MTNNLLSDRKIYFRFIYFVLCVFILASCFKPIIRKAPKGRPYLTENSFEVRGGNFTSLERSTLVQRLKSQLEDSSTYTIKDMFFFIHILKKPPAYDSIYSSLSANNMKYSMFNLGYYDAVVSFKADTSKSRVHVHYLVESGKPTRIDTVSYNLKNPSLQEIALQSRNKSMLRKNDPITKNAVLAEINRLVDSFRNNGYYKFTAAELKVIGDTSIAVLTTISNDPFEQLSLLAEAQQKADSPQIKIAVVLNPPSDTGKLRKYYVQNIYVLSDFSPKDDFSDSSGYTVKQIGNFIHRYHEYMFSNSFLYRNINLKSGNLYRQDDYNTTLNNLSKAGVWQSVNIKIIDYGDVSDKIDFIIELIPARKFGFETSLELSYSANSNASTVLGGNLFGVSGNVSLTNRNVGKQAIRMSHKVRAGVEINNNNSSSNSSFINSNELSYNNNILFPKLLFPEFLKLFPRVLNKRGDSILLPSGESFINTNLSYNNRLNLFNLQGININFGWRWKDKRNYQWEVRPLNLSFNNLYNRSDSFNTILIENSWLNYSYNTAYVVGMGASMAKEYLNPIHPKSLLKQRSTKVNIEESGLTWSNIAFLKKYLRRYIKLDVEYKYTVTYNKSAIAFRLFGGVGIPLLGSDTNRTLPFFKQYVGGGSNSMRGWPIRGIGIGGQPLAPFNSSRLFNDRTGDMQLEGNMEYRYTIAHILPNTLTLKGALFADVGNIWNMRNKNDGTPDSALFRFKNIYKQMGVSAGTGLRLDFNNFLIRFDFGLRFKRPELFYINDGWQTPSIGFDDFLRKIFSKSERQWRYENFNFSIGINYPF